MIGLMLVMVFLLSFMLTGGVRRCALSSSFSLMDVPNHRSSHDIPTPRGGGLAFVIVFLMAIPAVIWMGFKVSPVGLSLIGAGGVIAAIGFMDDYLHLSQYVRLLGHVGISMAALYWMGGVPPMEVFGWMIAPGLFLNTMAVLYLVWLLNLYNFMDGINGLAAVQALSVCGGMALLYGLDGAYVFAGLPLALAAAVAGFLGWNFPSARIFMGDVGSGFLGLVLGILSLQAASIRPAFFWAFIILLGVFIVDATVTVFYRLCRGENIAEGHRSHAYQKAARCYGGHAYVTLFVLLLNIGWLLPIALLVGLSRLQSMLGLVMAYLPLLMMAIIFKAGQGDE